MSNTRRLLYLIRHGATEANLRQPYVLQGQRSDLPLSMTGRRQAEAVSKVIERRPIQAIFTSPLQRARETAAIVAQPHGIPAQPVDALSECDVGEWEGLSWHEVRQRNPEYHNCFHADPAATPYLGGESFQQVLDRAVPAIDQIIRSSQGDIAIVTHNIVGRVYVAHLTATPIAKARSIQLDNAGISIVVINDGKQKLQTLNSVLHLDGLLDNP